MAIQTKRFSWLRSPTGWQQFQGWQEKRRAMRESFDNARSMATSGFGEAWTSQIDGTANLAGQAALDRIQAAAKAKFDKSA
ncbi:MAG TPA: hypothetical protein VGD36_13685 [Xanthobacteraceae bacterium]